MLAIEQLDMTALAELAVAITAVLDSRTHRRKYLGEEILVKGSLSKALHLPDIQRRLQSSREEKRQQGRDELARLWQSLSPATRDAVITQLGWYDPHQLDWDDPRSNRRPVLTPTKDKP
ncbi:MAG TPA: hypothetical protein VIN71_07935 [Pseudomonadales bacterium]